jgi:hypothetical protein
MLGRFGAPRDHRYMAIASHLIAAGLVGLVVAMLGFRLVLFYRGLAKGGRA